MKKTTVACDACKKRKGKCTGTSPCTRCAEAGIPCTYLQGNKKRGPVSKKQKTAQFNVWAGFKMTYNVFVFTFAYVFI